MPSERLRVGAEDTFCRDALPPKHLWPDFDFSGVPGGPYPEQLNCASELLDSHVAHGHGDRVAFHYSDEQWTYAELMHFSNRIAHVLVEDFALVPGNRVLLRGGNSPSLVACWFGVIKAGCVAVCTPPLLRTRELLPIIEKAEVNLCITDSAMAAECQQAVVASGRDVQVVAFGTAGTGSIEERAATKNETFDNVETAADDVAIIAFTSGTTGDPKGTMHFHRDLLAVSDCFAGQILNASADDVFCGTPPLAFTYALGGLLLFPMRIGASSVLLDHGSPQTLLEAINKYRPTICFTSPTGYRAMLRMLDQFDVTCLRKCVSAGEPLTRATFEAWRAATGIETIDGIGSTELLHIFISAAHGDIRPGSIGKVVPGYQASLLDENGSEVSPGTVGRLAVRGPTGCRYLADLDRQTQYVMRGWNITGDACRMDVDGYFWYEGRTDDMIVSAGYKIAPPEIESVLLEHPKVAECAVIGVPDATRGQIVKAFVVVKADVVADGELVKDLQTFAKTKIAPYKYPRDIKFLRNLPRTATGKLQRHLLREEG